MDDDRTWRDDVEHASREIDRQLGVLRSSYEAQIEALREAPMETLRAELGPKIEQLRRIHERALGKESARSAPLIKAACDARAFLEDTGTCPECGSRASPPPAADGQHHNPSCFTAVSLQHLSVLLAGEAPPVDDDRLDEVLAAAEAWATEYGPWRSGNPDHAAGHGPEHTLYNALVRWARGGRKGVSEAARKRLLTLWADEVDGG